MGIAAPDQVILGTYETEARVMAVLDSVQGKIESVISAVVVLEMPKE